VDPEELEELEALEAFEGAAFCVVDPKRDPKKLSVSRVDVPERLW
jgi:hypothetical protein